MTEPKAKPTPRKRAPARTPAAPAPSAIIDALNAATASTDGITLVLERLVTSMDNTDATNKDTKRWRRRLTVAVAVAIIAMVGMIVAFHHSDQVARKEDSRQAQRTIVTNLGKCQDRNFSARYSRDLDDRLIDALQALKAPPAIVDPLRASIASAPKDVDCDNDGRLTTSDYPASPVAG